MAATISVNLRDYISSSDEWFFLNIGYYYLETVFPQKVPEELLPTKPILILPCYYRFITPDIAGKEKQPPGIAIKMQGNIRVIVDPPIRFRNQRFFEKYYPYEYILIIHSAGFTRIKQDVGRVLSYYYEWLDYHQKNAMQLVPCISLNMFLWELFGHEFLHFALKHIEIPMVSRATEMRCEAEMDSAFYQYFLRNDPIKIQVYEFLKWFYEKSPSF
jgi:hypothetical protein